MNNQLAISGVGKRNRLVSILREECDVRGITLLGLDAAPNPPAMYELDHFCQIPLASHDDFIYKYIDAIEGALGFLTIVDPEILPLSIASRSNLFNGSTFLHPDYSTCKICEDKLDFFEYLCKSQVRVLPTSSRPEYSFPMIVKDRRGSCSSGFRILAEPAALDTGLSLQPISTEVIYQPYCDGIHYCVDAYYSLRSRKLVDLCAKRVSNKSSGESHVMTSVVSDRFISFLSDLDVLFDFSGIVNFDIYDWRGSLYLMEVNCRIGGNYPVSHLLGCNLVAKMLDELTGLSDYSNGFNFSKYQVGATCFKYFDFAIVSSG